MVTIAPTPGDALAEVPDGSTILIGGFGLAGHPIHLIDALLDSGARHLTVVNNNAGNGDTGVAALIRERRVDKIICSFPRQHDSDHFNAAYTAGQIKLELVPQGNLAERLRAAGAGIGAFYTPTGYGTDLANGKETRTIDGRGYVLEYPLRGDFALVKADTADQLGNLTYRKTARNFGPIMAAAATTTIAEVHHVVTVGHLDPETIITPSLYVNTVVPLPPQGHITDVSAQATPAREGATL